MILHAVMFTWKSGVTPQQVDALTSALHAMRGAIPGLISIRGGPDLGLRTGNPDYFLPDYFLIAEFENEDGWRAYQAHPRHKALLTDMIEPIVSSRQSMQIVA